MSRTGMARMIREAAARLGTFSVRELADAIGVQAYGDVRKVRTALQDFRRRGEILHPARGCWEYRGRSAARGKVRAKIYRAMHTSRIFSVKSITLLTDADCSYIRAVIRELIASGEIRVSGARHLSSGGKRPFYCIANPDDFYLSRVKGVTRDG